MRLCPAVLAGWFTALIALVHAEDEAASARRTTAALVNRRTDLCPRINELRTGSIELRDALRGVKLHAAVTLWDDGLLKKDDSGVFTGLYADMMTDLSRRAGFTYEFHEHPFAEGYGWTDWLLETIDLYDINVEYWNPTPSRTSQGAFPCFGLFDTSTEIASHKILQQKAVGLFSFMFPFSMKVWITCLLASVTTAAAYAVSEWGGKAAKGEEATPKRRKNHKNRNHDLNTDLMDDKLVEATMNTNYLSLMTITGITSFEPMTWSGKLITLSWGWCIMLFVAAYTANLAAFLIVTPPSEFLFAGFADAVKNGQTICVWKGTPQDEFLETYIKNNEPNYKGAVVTSEHPMEALHNGKCDGALGARVEVKTAMVGSAMNPCCSLSPVGQAMTFTESSWMVKNDYIDRCTALIRDVLFVYATEMKLEGIYAEMMNTYFASKASGHCESPAAVEERCPNGFTPGKDASQRRLEEGEGRGAVGRLLKGAKGAAAAAASTGSWNWNLEPDDKSKQMGHEEMLGMFMLHGVILLVGCLANIVHVIHKRLKKWSGLGEGDQDFVDRAYHRVTRIVHKLDDKFEEIGKATLECTACGNVFMADAKFCRKCGTAREGATLDDDCDEDKPMKQSMMNQSISKEEFWDLQVELAEMKQQMNSNTRHILAELEALRTGKPRPATAPALGDEADSTLLSDPTAVAPSKPVPKKKNAAGKSSTMKKMNSVDTELGAQDGRGRTGEDNGSDASRRAADASATGGSPELEADGDSARAAPKPLKKRGTTSKSASLVRKSIPDTAMNDPKDGGPDAAARDLGGSDAA
eukprot:TRINITY_DN4708_c0_g1_i3.p1 TRINITY_DN4708_c0_g1~~TRINITY_DN4708_c0_g1_i3.p1  ORF type:complete len:809 (-),score=149.62 TRINITY_DN4708_c0_g1_i3:210-2636(-)